MAEAERSGREGLPRGMRTLSEVMDVFTILTVVKVSQEDTYGETYTVYTKDAQFIMLPIPRQMSRIALKC